MALYSSGTSPPVISIENNGQYDFRDSQAWEEIYRVHMIFNRLVFYPGELFHAVATPFFGDAIENARLTQNLFVNLTKPPSLWTVKASN